MAQALSGPFLIAALTLCIAGVAKLRSPGPAADALRAARLPAHPVLIRAFAAAELGLGAFAAISADVAAAAALAAVYAGFVVLAIVLHRRGAACGCFGEVDAPASRWQAALSGVLALISAGAAVSRAHGVAWIMARSPATAMCLVMGIGAAVFATVVAYSELPTAWKAWSGE
jgi:hypothetical protein